MPMHKTSVAQKIVSPPPKPNEAGGALFSKGRPLSCEPGETHERSASLRMVSDSAAGYGQIRWAAGPYQS